MTHCVVQLVEGQKELQSMRERCHAAEAANAAAQQQRGAELALSRPVSPSKDSALLAEVQVLRQQVRPDAITALVCARLMHRVTHKTGELARGV